MAEPPHQDEPHDEPQEETAKAAHDSHRHYWRLRSGLSAWGLANVLFQAYLWGGFLAQRVRAPAPTYDVILYTVAIASGTGTIVWCVVHRRSLWLASAWLAYTLSQLTVNFSYLYWSHGSASDFNMPLTHLDAIYVTVGTLSTAGSGAIAPISQTTRGFQTLQNVLDLGLLLFAVALFVTRFSDALGGEDT